MANASALMGEPPISQDDYYIVKGMLRALAITDADPDDGFVYFAQKPPGYAYESKQSGIVPAMGAVIFIVVIITASRIGARIAKSRWRFSVEDIVIIPAALLAIAFTCIQIAMVTHAGAAQHIWDVTYAQYNTFHSYDLICRTLYFLSIGLAKISITLYCRRLSGMNSKAWRTFCDILLFVLTFYTLLSLFWTLFQCNPPAASWDKLYAGKLAAPAKCWDMRLIDNVLSVFNNIFDFILLSLPAFILYRVPMSLSKMLGLGFIWGIGALASVATILRQRTQHQLDTDVTWHYNKVLEWTLIAMSLEVVVASLPVIGALLPETWIRPRGSGHSQSSENSLAGLARGREGSLSQNSKTDDLENYIIREDRFEVYSTHGDETPWEERTTNIFFGDPQDASHPATWRLDV